MENLAAKYRPQDLSDMTEQTVVVDILNNICSKDVITHRNFLLIGPAGTGKAQPLYSKVLTPSGYIRMEDVKIGTEVFTSNGNVGKISGIYPQGVRPIYQINLEDGTNIRVSDEHLNIVYRYNEDTKTREDFCVTTLQLIDLFNSSPFKLGIDTPSVNWPKRPLPMDPYLLGALLGAGSLGNDLQFSNTEEDVVNKVDSLLRRDWNLCLQKCPGNNAAYGIVSTSLTTTTNTLHDTSSFNASLQNVLKNLDLLCTSTEKYISKIYLHSDRNSRLELLQGLLDTAGYIDSSGSTSFTTSYPQLSSDFAYLVRSLGIRDSVSIYSSGSEKDSTCTYTELTVFGHDLKIPNTLDCCSSAKYTARREARQTDVIRNIVSIDYVGKEVCQCLMIDHPDHTYISDDFIPTHNTTLGKIIAKRINGGSVADGNIIEIDAASHSGVDAMRDIVNQARVYPVGSKYKVFIIDECVEGSTEILTDEGFKRIDSLNKTEKIAQYTKSGSIEFVKPSDYVEMEYSGRAYRMHCPNGVGGKTRLSLMSPNHVQPQRVASNREIVEEYIKDAEFYSGRQLIVSGEGTGCNDPLSPLDKLAIAVQADGYCQPESASCGEESSYRWQIHLSEEEKINKIRCLLADAHIEYENWSAEGTHSTTLEFVLPSSITQEFSTYFNVDMGYDRASQFIAEVEFWSRSAKSNCYYDYHKENTDFISAILTLCGRWSSTTEEYSEIGTLCPRYCVNWFDGDSVPSESCSKTEEGFSGTIYCVKVPSQMIILRANGFTFISGNCHALSSASWQAALLTIESQPAMSVFIWCTTNPEKIPATILSRVQTFQLSKISLEGIHNRLKYIIEHENAEGRGITYDDDAVLYIAKLANGGMRDAITQLDKALSFSTDVTIESLQKSLGLPNYDDYFDLLNAIARKDNEKIVSMINSVYNSGTNFTKWFDGFFSFVTNIVKFIYLQDINQTMIPSIYQDKIARYGTAHSALCLKLANKLVKMNQELKTTQYLQEIAISYLCTPPASKKG